MIRPTPAGTPQSFEACVARVMSRGKIGRSEALNLLQQVHDRGENMRVSGNEDPFLLAASELAGKMKEDARLNRIDAIQNANKRATILKEISDYGTAAQVLHETLRGGNVNSKHSVQSLSLSQAAVELAALKVQLERGAALKAAISGLADRDVAALMFTMRGESPVAASPVVKHIAEAYKAVQDFSRKVQNQHGARIGEDPNYIAHMQHDGTLMLRGGRGASGRISEDEAFQRWWAAIEPTAAEETFANIEPKPGETEAQARMRFGRSFFNAASTNLHFTPEGVAGFAVDQSGFVQRPYDNAGRNIAKSVSQPKIWHFKDGAAFYDYNQKYGRFDTLYESVQRSLQIATRNAALMEKLGTTPKASLDAMAQTIHEKYRDTDLGGSIKFKGEMKSVMNELAHLDGTADHPIHSLATSIGEAARKWFDMAMLGGVQVTHATSLLWTIPSELRHHGIGAGEGNGLDNMAGSFGNMARTIKIMFSGAGDMERKQLDASLGAWIGGYTYEAARDWRHLLSPGGAPLGRTTALHSLFMQGTLIRPLFDRARRGMMESLSHMLGAAIESGTAFDNLHPALQNRLGMYRIDAEAWGHLSELKDLQQFQGRPYLTPSDALRTPGGEDLAKSLMMYLHDGADQGIITPGAREKAILHGSGASIWRQLFMQFKLWPMAAYTQGLEREIKESLSRGQVAWGLGLTVATATIGGYLRWTLNNVTAGQPPPNFRDPFVLLGSLARGGALGILGDSLLHEFDNAGARGLVTGLMGPGASKVNDISMIFERYINSVRTGRKYDAWPDLLNWSKGLVPGANMIYIKGAFDYLLFYHLLEAARPGWWERTNQRLEREKQGTMAGYAPGRGIPYTPWGIGGAPH